MPVQYLHSLQIGTVSLPNNLALAPMAGTSDLAFRPICRRFGAGLTVTELVSARGVCFDADFRRNWRYLVIDPTENPVAIQLFGNDPADFRNAIRRILEHPVLGQCSLIDLNMGCPVAKVVKAGAGAALMQNPGLAARIIEASVRTAADFGKPVSVKFRKGWDDHSVNAVPFARMTEQSGAAALTIHGRTRAQMYGGRADWLIIGEVKAAVKIPVFGNGDVDSPSAARRLTCLTAVDGLMIGRAAQGNPWIFKWLSDELQNEQDAQAAPLISPDEKIPIILEHFGGLAAMSNEETAAREMRQQMAFYFRGTPHGADLRRQASQIRNRSDLLAVLEEWRIKCKKYCETS